jgi:uncharacterized protein (DUF1501 family)
MITLPTNRRQFLRATLGSSALVSLGLDVPLFVARSAEAAAGQRGRAKGNVLVIVQLSGGNDGLNTVIPYADPAYAKNRAVLRIPQSQIATLDSEVGLHPSLFGLAKLLEQGRLAVIQGVGYPNPDRSHFRSMDIWHSAQPEKQRVIDGWLGRAVEQRHDTLGADVPALHLGGDKLPLALVSRGVAVPSVESLESFRLRTVGGAVPIEALRKLAEAPRPHSTPLLDFVRRSTLSAYASSEQVQAALADERAASSYAGHPLARKLQTVAQLIDAGLDTSIYYLSLDGFDTHANQAAGHAALLRELSESVASFMADLAGRGHLDRVLLMTFSEFGRRVKENASAGTDHGAAAPLFITGGRVRAGLLGKHPSLTDLDSGDLKFHTDFRRVYATLLDQWLGCPSELVLSGKFEHLQMLKSA